MANFHPFIVCNYTNKIKSEINAGQYCRRHVFHLFLLAILV